jgi:dTDP-glucose pyrophosphorylase
MSLDEFLVTFDVSIRVAMEHIDRNAKGIVLVVDDTRHLQATITDGDIRRAILAGIDLDAPIRILLRWRSQQDGLVHRPITASIDTPESELLELMNTHTIRQIPLLSAEGQVEAIAFLDDLIKEYEQPIQAVVMAGGFGKRLRPLTEALPKPMLPIGDQPLLELTIQRLRESGIQQVNVTTHYLPEKITEYFGDGSDFGVELNYVTEDRPLGTAGSLGLVTPSQEPLLVINGDILTGVDFQAMLAHHQEHQADLTVGTRQYEYQVPYGVIDCEGYRVQGVREKPILRFWFNAGIYLLEPSVRDYIPTGGQRFDMTDLIEALIADQRKVISFPITEYWQDIGHPEDYRKAQEDVQKGRFSP